MICYFVGVVSGRNFPDIIMCLADDFITYGILLLERMGGDFITCSGNCDACLEP